MNNEELLYLIEKAAKDKVTELDLSWKALTTLPPEIGKLSNLRSLNLSFNQLSSLPPEIRELPNLEKLDLHGNPIPIPPEILGSKDLSEAPGNVNEILDFYFRVQDPAETEPLYEAKFLIVGEGGAGKTSLAKKIKDETYKLQPDEESTEGIEVIRWYFTQPNGQDFRVNIWDFGGQAIYHETHQFFLSKRSLYTLVVDTRKENTDFYWWLNVVGLLSDNSPVLIIKNEKQDRQCEVNERQLRGEFTNLKEVLATNLDTNRGLAEIKDAIQLYISRLPHVGTPLPKLWVRVRAALENYSRNYISQEEYCHLCLVNNLTDRKDMLRLSSYLHDLGVCLHFQDDATLKHYVILKPEWGTTAVYKVLDNDTVKKHLGCFTRDDLEDIWQDGEYAQMRDELLQLMMRFKLCYEIPSRPGTFIAPQLLSIEQPDYTWDDTNNLILRYTYDFMPKGILTRFIVKTHPWIEQQKLVWKTGVVLHKDQTRAEVTENYNQREIKIRVTGNRKKELMAVITSELEKIHRSYERLQYQTLVPCNCRVCSNNQQPYFYPLSILHQFINSAQWMIQCQVSFHMVDVRGLIDDLLLTTQELETTPENLPIQILTKSIDSAKKYKELLNMVGHEFLYEAKIMIVGEPGAGKTSLMKKLIDCKYQVPNDEKSTLGINVYSGWEFINNKDNLIKFRANIWDFGGQEVQYALHQFFLTERSLYVLVVDDRDQRTDFDYWFNAIKALGGSSPVLVVLNEKNYKYISNFDIKTYRERYSQLSIKCCNVDLSANDCHFEYLVKIIQEMLFNLKHIGDKFPKKWIQVREELENLKYFNYIKIEQYVDICKRYGIQDEDEQLLLSGYLHDLGIILHFSNDSNLYNFLFLNPQWIVDAIYTILCDKKLERDGGKFEKNWLFEFWHHKGYSQYEEKLKLLSLMQRKNFDLCYKLDLPRESEEFFLFPQLLPSVKPDYKWNEQENLRYRIQYIFIPKGIIFQLIVRLSNYLDRDKFGNDIAWKKGAVFVKDDRLLVETRVSTKAEVIEDINKDGLKVITIKISGTTYEKKSLLAILVKEIREINARFGNIEFKEQVPCNCQICKNINEPYFYNYHEDLIRRLENKIYTVECNKSFAKVEIFGLIDDVIDNNATNTIHHPNRMMLPLESLEIKSRNQVFISYSHLDKSWLTQLQTHLKPMIRNQKLVVWDDTKIEPGTEWYKEIEDALAAAKVAVLMVSPNFLASDFIADNELPPLLNAAQDKGLTIIWIPISFSSYNETEIAKYQAVHDPKQPLKSLSESDQDAALVKICQEIKTAFQSANE